MQEQRSTVESFPEAFEFDHASSSSSSAIDRHVYWNNVLNIGDPRNTPEYLLSSSGENMSLRSVVSQETGTLSDWNLGGSGSSETTVNRIRHDESQMENRINRWTSTLTANVEAGPSLEERRLEAADIRSLDNVGINLNTNPTAQEQIFLQNSFNDSDHEARFSNTGQVSQPGTRSFYNPLGPEVEQIPSAYGSTNPCGTSVGAFGYLSDDADGRPENLLDGRRLSGKRKNIEGVSGQSSGSGSCGYFQQTENGLLHNVSTINISSSSLNTSRSLDNLSSVNSPEERLNPRHNTLSRAAASGCLPSTSAAGSAEGSQRNFRMRINPAHEADSSAPDLWALGNSSRRPSVWSSHQPPPLFIPLNFRETRPTMPCSSSENQSPLPSVPGVLHVVHPLPWNGTSNSRVGSYSDSPVMSSERSTTLREEADSRVMQRNNISEHPIPFPADELQNGVEGPTNWSLANDNISIPGDAASASRVGSSAGVHPSISATWLAQQNPPNPYPQGLSDFAHRAFPPANSDIPGQLNNFLPQPSVHSSSSQQIASQSGSVRRTHQQPPLRSAFLMDRRSDFTGPSLRLRTLAAVREGRSRVISEHIRNALDLMLRGENIRFESAFHGVADSHDRHRDMRLDVDNMSYEELLALEERIGNVSTGLSEETILKHLKQQKYFCITLMPSGEAEPCCICQEEYLDDDDLGTLDCGHDFHTTCIKQWLMHKNLCPICKTTALFT